MTMGSQLEGGGNGRLDGRTSGTAVATRTSIGVLLASALIGISALALSSNETGLSAAAGALTKARSMMAMLAERSPGTRTTAELTKTKRKLAVARPHERALGKIRRAPIPPEFLKALAPGVEFADSVPILNLNPLIDVPPAQFAMADIPPIDVIGGTGGVPGGSIPGGGGSSSAPLPPTTDTPVPQTAVPEPGTWAMMLLGFLGLGMQLKRGRRKSPMPLRLEV